MKKFSLIQNEKGSTILENIVAFSILTGVIILLLGTTMKIISKSNSTKIWQAANLAQSEMELLLSNKTYSDSLYQVERWKINRTIMYTGNKANIKVQVYFKNEKYPLVEFNSVRLCLAKVDSQ
jgi:uncharacterized protein (UPF0333 family)